MQALIFGLYGFTCRAATGLNIISVGEGDGCLTGESVFRERFSVIIIVVIVMGSK
jgi:hypothetical protein